MDKEKADAPLRPDTRMLLHLAIRRVTVDPLGRAPHTGITGGRAGSHGWVRTRRCNRGRSQRGQRSKLSQGSAHHSSLSRGSGTAAASGMLDCRELRRTPTRPAGTTAGSLYDVSRTSRSQPVHIGGETSTSSFSRCL